MRAILHVQWYQSYRSGGKRAVQSNSRLLRRGRFAKAGFTEARNAGRFATRSASGHGSDHGTNGANGANGTNGANDDNGSTESSVIDATEGVDEDTVYDYDSDDYEPTEEEIRRRNDREVRQRKPSFLMSTGASPPGSQNMSIARVTDSIVHAYRGTRAMLTPSIKRTSAAVRRVRERARQIHEDLPEDTWGKILWVWDRPGIQKIRLTFSMVNLSFRLPALVALVVTQGSLLASQVSLPMLAPLLLGTGMMMRSIKTNASFLFPRLGLLVVMLWYVLEYSCQLAPVPPRVLTLSSFLR